MVGTVLISLDFELGWGHRTARPEYVDRLRDEAGRIEERIRSLVELFERHEIVATWAVVGRLLSPDSDPAFDGRDLFDALLSSSPAHEVGLHSHRHQPYDELTQEEAAADLKDGLEMLAEWNQRPRSFVFPQNRVAHIDLLRERGFTCYRTDRQVSRLGRLRELLRPETVSLPSEPERPVGLPETGFLAAQRRPGWLLKRMVWHGLEAVSGSERLVHYWLHPHNVVTRPSLLPVLDDILDTIDRYRRSGEVRVKRMAEVIGEPKDAPKG